jgi:hypothetical protein
MNTFRPVSIAHLVFGLIFLGAATLWAVGAATDADAPDLAVLAPAILIGAGAVGLVGIVINARNARRRAAYTDEASATPSSEYADTGDIHHEEKS